MTFAIKVSRSVSTQINFTKKQNKTKQKKQQQQQKQEKTA